MKILHVVTAFYPAWVYGGQVRVAYEICKRLAEKHKVTVVTTDVYDKNSRVKYKKNPSFINNIKIYRFKNISNRLAWKRYHTPVSLVPFSKREIKNFDVVHIHGARSIMHIPVYYYLKKNGIPYILQAHGSLPRIMGKQRLKKLFDIVLGHGILKNASKVIALTETEAKQYKKMGVDENKIEIVPNGIDLSEYENLPDKGVFRNKYGIKSNEKIVLYLGRIHKSKGVDLLIDAFSDISKELNDTILVLIGPNDGHQQSLVKRTQKLEINDKILFTGFVTNEEKLAAFVDADVFVTPSFSGFPITFLEACACGTPIITTNNGDMLDWIHDKVGYVVEYDEEQLQDAMFEMLNDDGLRRRFGDNGRKLVEDQFNWDNIIKKVEKLYGNLLRDISNEKH